MRLARTIRFDASDDNVFERAAESGEWAISGAFEFSNWTEADVTGKRRQAFTNGWLGLSTFGRATFVATADITQAEYDAALDALARHFVEAYGAPGMDAARPVAAEELGDMRAMCEDHDPNTLLIVTRELVPAGVSEAIRTMRPQDAPLEIVAIHGERGDI